MACHNRTPVVKGACLWSLGVHDLHRVAPAGDVEDGGVVKVVRELLSVQGRAGYQQLDVGPEARNVLDLYEERSC